MKIPMLSFSHLFIESSVHATALLSLFTRFLQRAFSRSFVPKQPTLPMGQNQTPREQAKDLEKACSHELKIDEGVYLRAPETYHKLG